MVLVHPPLHRLLAAAGEPLVDVLAAPHGLDVPITGLAIVDPEDDPDVHPGRLVLVIGARGRDALGPLRALARAGAAAVAVKTGDAAGALAGAAAAGGVALLAVRPQVRWERLETAFGGVLDADAPDEGPDDLDALARTVALLTGGIVSIEDTASRVLAYSRSVGDDAQADELRRLTILGRQGPPEHLRRLREWGVFDRLRAGEDVVRIEEHAELGLRARLAVGIHAGQRPLGTIWVQEGAAPFAQRSEQVLLGAARVAAGLLVQRRRAVPSWDRELVTGLLDGRVSPDLVASASGLDEHASVLVAGFAVRAGGGAERELGVAELADVVAVHAAAHRRAALVGRRAGRVYAVLPDVARDALEPGLRAMCAEVVAVATRRAGVRVQAGIGSAVEGLAGVPASRAEADRVLEAMPADADVASFGDLRAEVLLAQTVALVRERPDLRDPAVARLLAYDRAHGGDLAVSVLAWLDALGDVRAAAEHLTVHPNTLRYRIRRAVAVAGLALGDPHARLVHHLNLLAATRADAVRSDNSAPAP